MSALGPQQRQASHRRGGTLSHSPDPTQLQPILLAVPSCLIPLDACLKSWVCPAGCLGPGMELGSAGPRGYLGRPLPSHHTHVQTEKGAPASCVNPQRRAPRVGGKCGAQAVGRAPNGQAYQVGDGGNRVSTQMEAPGMGTLTPPGKSSQTRFPHPITAPRHRLPTYILPATLAYGSLSIERPPYLI